MTLCDNKALICIICFDLFFVFVFHSFSGNVQAEVHMLIMTNHKDVCHLELMFFSSPKQGANSRQEF